MGLKPREFEEMTVGEFARFCYYRDVTLATEWSQFRMAAAATYRTMSTKKIKDSDVLELWTDFLSEEEQPKQVIKGGKELEEYLAAQQVQNPLP